MSERPLLCAVLCKGRYTLIAISLYLSHVLLLPVPLSLLTSLSILSLVKEVCTAFISNTASPPTPILTEFTVRIFL